MVISGQIKFFANDCSYKTKVHCTNDALENLDNLKRIVILFCINSHWRSFTEMKKFAEYNYCIIIFNYPKNVEKLIIYRHIIREYKFHFIYI